MAQSLITKCIEVHQRVSLATESPHVSILVVLENTMHCIHATGLFAHLSSRPIEYGTGLTWAAIQHGKPLLTLNAHLSGVAIDGDQKPIPHHQISIPLIATGIPLGVIHVAKASTESFSVASIAELEIIATNFLASLEDSLSITASFAVALENLGAELNTHAKLPQGFTKRVANRSEDLALHLGLSPLKANWVRWGALLLNIADAPEYHHGVSVSTKSRFERSKILLDAISHLPLETRDAVLFQWAHWDGSSQIHSQRQATIPLSARITSASQRLEELLNLQQNFDQALGSLRQEAGTRFDPVIVRELGHLGF